jgi:biopolymer transport protein ExbD
MSQESGTSLTSLMAKVRGRLRREIASAEEAEYEGGELNLVPYLDILINTIIFLLATTASALTLANINVNSPRYEDAAPGQVQAEQQDEDAPKLNLTVAVSYTGFIIGGKGAIMTAKDGTLPTIRCTVPVSQGGMCPVQLQRRDNARGEPENVWIDKYDYPALDKMMQDIKKQYGQERQVILTADRSIPYMVVVKTMDTLRGTSTLKCTGTDGCLFDQVVLSAGVQ